ncbi:MAG: HAD-IA family hydrolase [Candidatus Saccharimonadales bacterium]
MLKAIIFDCFDVLVGNGLPLYCQKYLKNDPKLMSIVKKYEIMSNAGKISYSDFVAKLSDLAEAKPEDVERILDENPVNQELISYITKDLRPKYKISILSNASGDWIDDFFNKDQRRIFDDIVLSFQHGIVKPDQAIYLLAASRLGLAPKECLFIDDKETYCKGAEAVGMRAIQYLSLPQLRQDLGKTLSTS